jgi:hypothetical protein
MELSNLQSKDEEDPLAAALREAMAGSHALETRSAATSSALFGLDAPTPAPAPAAKPAGAKVKVGVLGLGRIKADKPVASMSESAARIASVDVETCCPACGSELATRVGDVTCGACGLVVEGEHEPPPSDEPKAYAGSGRVRMFGPDARKYQANLDRCSMADNRDNQLRTLVQELRGYHLRYVTANPGRYAPPIAALTRAAYLYHEIQRTVTKRNLQKRYLLAACTEIACIELGLAPTKQDLSELFQLNHVGTAQGTNYLMMMKSHELIDFDPVVDPTSATINDAFIKMGIDAPAYGRLREAVHRMVEIATTKFISSSSVIRSKVLGSLHIVLARHVRACKITPRPVALVRVHAKPGETVRFETAEVTHKADSKRPASELSDSKAVKTKPTKPASDAESSDSKAVKTKLTKPASDAESSDSKAVKTKSDVGDSKEALIPALPLGFDASIGVLCTKCEIRKGTLDRFITDVTKFTAHFAAMYKEFGLYEGPL